MISAASAAWVADGGHQSTTWRIAQMGKIRFLGATRNPIRSAGDNVLLNVPT